MGVISVDGRIVAVNFFAVDDTPAEQRIHLVGIHLEGKALKWHLSFMKRRHEDELAWDEYFEQMQAISLTLSSLIRWYNSNDYSRRR